MMKKRSLFILFLLTMMLAGCNDATGNKTEEADQAEIATEEIDPAEIEAEEIDQAEIATEEINLDEIENQQDKSKEEQYEEYLIDIREEDSIAICQDYMKKNDSAAIETITNWDNPDVTVIEELPDAYFKISDTADSDVYFKITFTTSADAILGPIEFFMDNAYKIIGQGYRE